MACVRRTLPRCVAGSAGAKHQACCAAQPMQVCVDRCAESWPGLVGASRWQRGDPWHRQDEVNDALVADADGAEGETVLWSCAQEAGQVCSRFVKPKAVADCDMVPGSFVGDILSAGPHSGKQGRLSLAAGRPRPIRTEHGISGATSSGLLDNFTRLLDRRHAWSSAPAMTSISRAASLERLTLA